MITPILIIPIIILVASIPYAVAQNLTTQQKMTADIKAECKILKNAIVQLGGIPPYNGVVLYNIYNCWNITGGLPHYPHGAYLP